MLLYLLAHKSKDISRSSNYHFLILIFCPLTCPSKNPLHCWTEQRGSKHKLCWSSDTILESDTPHNLKWDNVQFQSSKYLFVFRRHGICLQRLVKIFHPCQKYLNVRNVIISPAVLTGQLSTTSSPACAMKVGISASEDMFKEAAEAYEVLGDKEKKTMYDRYGHAGIDQNFGGGGFSCSIDS